MNVKGTIKKKILGVLAIAGALAVIVWAVGCRKNGNGNAGVSSTVSTTSAGLGLYKVWAQFQRGGRVITVPFVLSVAAG